jgi:hypothetical protein
VLRRNAGRVRYEPGDRVWFAPVARLLPWRRWTGIFPVTPATLLAWHRKLAGGKYDTSRQRKPGRPPTAPGIARLVVRLARENRLWARYSSDALRRCHRAPHRRLDGAAGPHLSLTLGERFEDINFLVRDRGSNFTDSFDAVFQASGTRIVRTVGLAVVADFLCVALRQAGERLQLRPSGVPVVKRRGERAGLVRAAVEVDTVRRSVAVSAVRS